MAKSVSAEETVSDTQLKDELAAAMSAQHELGEQYHDQVAVALAERIESLIDERVEAATGALRERAKSNTDDFLKVTATVSAFGIPLAIVGAFAAGATGFFTVLAMIFVIHIVWLWRSR